MTPITKDRVVSVKRVFGPHYDARRDAYTGMGWVVDTWGEVNPGGRVSAHTHYAFKTREEAKDVAAELREKMA
jgi:hypothetical protein